MIRELRTLPEAVGSRAARCRLAVVSDGTGFHREPGSTVLTGLLQSAGLLRDHAGIDATAVLVTANTGAELLDELRHLAAHASAIYLAHTDPTRAQLAPTALAGQLPVITDLQTIAAALTAATLTALARARIPPPLARVMIVGADRNPVVGLLGTAAGIGRIDTRPPCARPPCDAHGDALRTSAGQTHAVIDLLGIVTPGDVAPTSGPLPPIIAVDEPAAPLLALPHLLATARATMRPTGLATCLAATLALVRETPADRLLPTLSGSRATPTLEVT